jgi:hypothetical protein
MKQKSPIVNNFYAIKGNAFEIQKIGSAEFNKYRARKFLK